MNQDKKTSRRNMLRRSSAVLGAVILTPLVTHSPQANAGSMTKGMLHYQDTPKDGKMCADCAAYNPPTPDTASGTCKVVAGPVNPQGWCMAYSHR
ncbi:High potential iron-sulfur protein [Collimonas sp. OK307]|uniref:high-potential iron-sulfur protein n=1 Tax=Collimonas sp. OK307 TaxID=1801620 RepID=UPI0008EAEAED|nr:high-potential iron-sulfur protein [Collimonas sp. OK307]SFI02102.1 High potential iron-sulfur protein [Collimonas sp. OK307]